MSRVWGRTDPSTSVPIIASVPETRSQTSIGNSASKPMKMTPHSESIWLAQYRSHWHSVMAMWCLSMSPPVPRHEPAIDTTSMTQRSPTSPNPRETPWHDHQSIRPGTSVPRPISARPPPQRDHHLQQNVSCPKVDRSVYRSDISGLIYLNCQ